MCGSMFNRYKKGSQPILEDLEVIPALPRDKKTFASEMMDEDKGKPVRWSDVRKRKGSRPDIKNKSAG